MRIYACASGRNLGRIHGPLDSLGLSKEMVNEVATLITDHSTSR
jgi:hypothetical protein